MAIADDFSVALDGSIRYTGSGTNYTVLAFKNYLGALLDDAQASGDDLADITTDTIYERSTDQILTLNSPFNVDDTAIEHLYDGSITQNGGDDVYSGLYVVGVVESGTIPMIVQNNKVLAPYWGTGINGDPGENIIMKIMVKTRSNGADINNKKVRVLAREFGDKYAEFDVTLGTANNTAAIFTSNDLNNESTTTTVEGWYGNITNTEGYQLIDIDGNGSDEEYYSQWDKGTRSLNDVYEYTKWVAMRADDTDSNAETGNDFIVDNLTITGRGAEFSSRPQQEILVEARFRLKRFGTPTGSIYATLYDSDDGSPAAPTGSILATSVSLNANRLTTSYQECIFRFTTPYTMNASQEYFIVINHPDGDASNYVQVEGDTSTGDDGNQAYNQAGWIGVSGEQLNFYVKSSPLIHSMAGELFRGISVEVAYDTESGGPFQEDEIVGWGTDITYDGLNGSFAAGMFVSFWNGSTQVNSGKILYDNGSTQMKVALQITGSTLADGYDIKDVDAPTTNYATINTTITNQDKAGGQGVLLALDDNGSSGELYMQVIYGANPVNTLPMRGMTSNCTANATSTINTRSISAEFVGQSTGSNIIGAYGIGFDKNDVGANDLFFDLSNTPRQPPNNVIFTISGLVSGEDRLLIGPRSGSALNKAQYALNTTLSGAAETSCVISAAIWTETPGAGWGTALNSRLRIELDTGIYRRQSYVSWTSSTFTLNTPSVTNIQIDASADNDTFTRQDAGDWLADGWDIGARFTTTDFTNPGNNGTWTVASLTATVITVTDGTGMVNETGSGDEDATVTGWDYTDPNDAASTNDVFMAYIDVLANASTESFTAVHGGTDRDLLIRVRDGGGTPIKTIENSATFTGSPQTITINRVNDY